MSLPNQYTFVRADIWREGKWVDLWSVVHFISGISIGFGLYALHFDQTPTVAFTILALICYEMWEALVGIEEVFTNRFMDVVVGLASFLPVYFLVAPHFARLHLIFVFILVLTVNIIGSIIGWRASQKAAALAERMRIRYAKQREEFLKRRSRLSWRDDRDMQ